MCDTGKVSNVIARHLKKKEKKKKNVTRPDVSSILSMKA